MLIRKTFLVISSLIFSLMVMPILPILGLQNSSQNISSWGSIEYPEHELGVFHYWSSDYFVPLGADWVVAAFPEYVAPRSDIDVILNYYKVHTPSSFETAAELNTVETLLKAVPIENFWGILFIREEHNKMMINFDNDVDTTWFGEVLLGYTLYEVENPGVTEDEWKDEMYLRMIRGFYVYFHPLTNVGITAGGPALYHPRYREDSYLYYYGASAMAYIQANYDFVFIPRFTTNLVDYKARCEPYLEQVDRFFPAKTKFAVITRRWPHNVDVWEYEAIALEMKNFLDRGCVVMTYEEHAAGGADPPFSEMWTLLLKGRQLYDSEVPYFENYVYGENLLTGYIGNTYGWVKE